MALDLTFQPTGGGGGSSSGDFVKDAFSDITLPASNNSGLTSTAATNPLGEFFANDSAPKNGVKTLWIEGIELIKDRTKWLDNKPTYKIIWNEHFPSYVGYVCGDVRLLDSPNGLGKVLNIRRATDFIGVTGVLNNAMWLAQPSAQATATALRYTDAVSGSNIDFSGAPAVGLLAGVNKYNAYLHSTNNIAVGLHDVRLVANQDDTLRVAGVVVYYENASNNVELFPGINYINKTKITTTSSTQIAFPVGSTLSGLQSVLFESETNFKGVTAQAVSVLSTIGVGSSGTNQITVTTDTGQSYMVGMGIVANDAGASFYVGTITNVSTDTLTVGPTLPFGVSSLLFRSWYAGSTVAISASLFKLQHSLDPAELSNAINSNGFNISATGDFYYQDPECRFRVWGDQLAYQAIQGYPSINFNGATVGFLQVDGFFSAAELEWNAFGTSSVIHGTFSVNGVISWGQNQGFTSMLKQTVFSDAAVGWNSLRFDVGASFFQVGINKINLYESAAPIGPTLGRLAEFKDVAGVVNRGTQSASIMNLGLFQRIYSDQLYFKGNWIRGTTTTVAGGVFFEGNSTNSALNFQFYGNAFSILGSAGTSAALTLDGASIGVNFNTRIAAATLGFHSVAFTSQTGTARVEAVDFYRPRAEFNSLLGQEAVPEVDTIPKVYIQGDTPRDAKDGDVWAQNPSVVTKSASDIWIKLWGLWHKLAVTQVTDDPDFDVFYRAYGLSGTASGTVTQDGEAFNFASWSAITTDSGTASYLNSGSQGKFQSGLLIIDGQGSVPTVISLSRRFNKFAWAAGTTRGSAKGGSSGVEAFGFYYSNKGSTDTAAANGTAVADKWNGSAWSSGTAWAVAARFTNAFLVGANISCVAGVNTSGSGITTHETKNSADANSSATATPAGGATRSSAGNGLAYGVQYGDASTAASVYIWSGSAWATVTSGYSSTHESNGTGSQARRLAIKNGGLQTSTTVANTEIYNGSAFITMPNSATARNSGVAACF